MRGTLYAISEILVFLVIATLIGILIGLWVASLRAGSAGRAPKTAPTSGDIENRLASAEAELAASTARSEEIEKELSMARWQIGTLEDELARRPAPDDED